MTRVIDHHEASRFELHVDQSIVYADYRRADGILTILYVEAPPALRGSGAAGRLMEGIMELARKENARIVPVCGYAAGWMLRYPDHKALMA